MKNAVAIAEAGRRGEVRYLGEVENTPEATRRLVARLPTQHEAGTIEIVMGGATAHPGAH
jgi:hypothetical protein